MGLEAFTSEKSHRNNSLVTNAQVASPYYFHKPCGGNNFTIFLEIVCNLLFLFLSLQCPF